MLPLEPDGRREIAVGPGHHPRDARSARSQALSGGAAHGYAVARWIEQATGDALAVGEGTLYPALHRLEERGWISASWGTSENNRQAKYYRFTRSGRARLQIETENWRRYAAALKASTQP